MLDRKSAAYAILLVAEVARRQTGKVRGVRAAEVADVHHLPAAYAAKILTQLRHAQVLQSDRGPLGGFRLNRPADSISLLEVVRAVDHGFLATSDPWQTGSEVHADLGSVCRVLREAVLSIRGALQGRTIQSILDEWSEHPCDASAKP